jgi:hypothetical protein
MSARGPVYRVTYNDETLIEKSVKPAAEACRALVALGLTGSAEMWRAGTKAPAMFFRDIAKAAELTTTEGEMSGPKVTKYVPFDRGAFVDDDAA